MENYVKVSSFEGRKGEVRRVLLLYSGGLDTSVMLKWIQDEYNAEVIALTLDIGQMADDLEEIRVKAIKLGAKKCVVVDAKREFAYQYIARGIRANARYQGEYHLATPLGRPLIAKLAVEVARAESCDCIAHGCTGKGNDQVRLEGSVLTLAPEMKIIAPVREWGMGREEEIAYAKKHGIPVKHTMEKPYSYDDNMWGISAEGGAIENPSLVPNLAEILQVANPIEKTPDTPVLVKIGWMRGVPVQLNGEDLDLPTLIMKLNRIGAEHGVGVVVHLEDRIVGLKIRNVYESPAACTLIRAHEQLEKFACTKQENEFKVMVDQKWAYLCYGGLWYEPLMDDLNAFIDKINEKVTGTTTVRLFKGHAEVVAVETPNSIFDEKLATFFKSNAFNQNASAAFTEIYTMQMRLSQEKERYALVTVGGDDNKEKFAAGVSVLQKLGYVVFATEGTHKSLLDKGIRTVLVHKISEEKLKPNLWDLLSQNRFDLIVNVPSPDNNSSEVSDGQKIRQMSAMNNVQLISNYDVFAGTIERLLKTQKQSVVNGTDRKPALL